MSTRHHIVTLVLLSSSTTALARPHHPRPEPSVRHQVPTELAKNVDVKTVPRFQALSDADGYPFVGNVNKTDGSDNMELEREARSARFTKGFVSRMFHVNGRHALLDL